MVAAHASSIISRGRKPRSSLEKVALSERTEIIATTLNIDQQELR